MSHIQGTDYVGSMVVMEDGLPKKSEYRRFKIRTVDGNNDFAAMAEVLERRLTNYLSDRDEAGRGAGQVRLSAEPDRRRWWQGSAVGVGRGVTRAWSASEIPIVSLAKQFEEVFVPGRPQPFGAAAVRGAVSAPANS